MIVDGRHIASELCAVLKPHFDALSRAANLGIVVCGSDHVIESFIRIKSRTAEKLGIRIVRIDLSEAQQDQAEVILAVQNLARDTDGVIVQLPLPKHFDTNAILSAIPPEKDVDAIHPSISYNSRPVHAPVALAVQEILRRYAVETEGRKAAIIGEGRLVGLPCSELLRRLGADVSVITLGDGSIDDLKTADIVILGAGEPGLVRPEHVKEGVVLIDAGTSEAGGKVKGDADPACAKVASVFTPVPGGVGPVAVAMIFKNLFDLVQKQR